MMIFGIDIENLSHEAILAKIDLFLREPRFHRIVTVNPEFLLEGERSVKFHDVLTGCDLRVVDGFGIVLAGWLHGVRLSRYPGADLLCDILAKAERDHLPVFFAVREDGLSVFDDVARAVRKKYPKLIFSGRDIDPGSTGNRKSEIGNFAIVLCNFGAPEQEYFLEGLGREEISSQLGMGVGGALDFLTGKRKRAPKWIRSFGIEWFWRFLLQLERAGRI